MGLLPAVGCSCIVVYVDRCGGLLVDVFVILWGSRTICCPVPVLYILQLWTPSKLIPWLRMSEWGPIGVCWSCGSGSWVLSWRLISLAGQQCCHRQWIYIPLSVVLLSSVIIGPSRVACEPPALHSYPRSGKALPVVMTMLNSITRNKPEHESIVHWSYQRPSIIMYWWSFVLSRYSSGENHDDA